MKRNSWVGMVSALGMVSASLVAGAVGCSGNKTDVTSSTGAGGSTVGASASSSSGGTPNPYACTVPATPPSGGTCVTAVGANDAGTGVECNPVTNAPCPTGYECDGNFDASGNDLIGFVCNPPPNSATLCEPCDSDSTMSTPSCGGGLTCSNVTTTQSVCARYCCTDADCGSGSCDTTDQLFAPIADNLGLCMSM